MMDATTLMQDLSANGISLDARDGRLIVTGRRDQLSPAMVTRIRDHKPELIRLIQSPVTVPQVSQTRVSGTSGTGTDENISGLDRRLIAWTDDDLMDLLNERIAIMHHDGRVPLDEAEKQASSWLAGLIGGKRFASLTYNARSGSGATLDTLEKTTRQN